MKKTYQYINILMDSLDKKKFDSYTVNEVGADIFIEVKEEIFNQEVSYNYTLSRADLKFMDLENNFVNNAKDLAQFLRDMLNEKVAQKL